MGEEGGHHERERSRFERLGEAFAAAVELGAGARVRYLERVRREDPALAQELEELLGRDACGGHGVRRLVAEAAEAAVGDGRLPLPERIGPFTVLGLLGRGGMSAVYRAAAPDGAEVALKLLGPALLTERFAARFDQERQVLARLRHPGIAQLHAAGTADLGAGPQPWIAMELVDGVRLAEWAEGRGTREKLALVVRLCAAVQHAHESGVIHRDLKPDNILVDRDGHPTVLDFGVARILDADQRITTLQSDRRSLIGTLRYMSPEQVSGASGGLDARCDVHALGVLTHELLAGELPWKLEGRSVAEVIRIIGEARPRPLSRLDPALGGELERIVLRALAKDPARRHASARALGDDLRRYLSSEG